MANLITIAGVVLPTPSSYSGVTSTLVDNGRNTQGVMIGSVIRDDIAKVEAKWSYLTVEQWATVNKLFKTSSGGSFTNSVTFFDQTEGGYVTREMYISDRKAGLYRVDSETGDILGWTDCSLSLVEV